MPPSLDSAAFRRAAKLGQAAAFNQIADLKAAQESIQKAQGKVRRASVKNEAAIMAAETAAAWAVLAREGWSFAGYEPWIATEGAGGPGPLVSRAAIKVNEKPRQIGHSEGIIFYAGFSLCHTEKASVAFVLHSHPAAVKMQDERVRPAIQETPILRENILIDNDMAKSFRIGGSVRFWNIYNAVSATGRGIAASTVALDEFQLHPPDKYAEIVSGIGSKDQDEWIGGTPLAPGNQLTAFRERGCDYRMLYGCPHCGEWNAPDIEIDSATRKPVSANVARNPAWDGTPANVKKENLPCAGCKFPATPCRAGFKCRGLIMVCSSCGGSLEHLRGRAGVFEDDGIGARRGAALWVPQHVNEKGEADLSKCASWSWTRFEISTYSIARVYASIESIMVSDPVSGVRLATNEQIGKSYSGGEGCMVQPRWVDAAKAFDMSFEDAGRLEYECVFCTVDWGDTEGYGTWVHVWGALAYQGAYRLVWLNAHQFPGEFIPQREAAAKWAFEQGAQLALVDAGFMGGGDKIFAALFGEARVIRIDHSFRRTQTDDTPYIVAPPSEIAVSRVFKIPKAQAFAHMVACLSQTSAHNGRTVNDTLIIPWRRPDEVMPFVKQWFNVYRGTGEKHNKAVDGLEIVGDEREGFRKAGPMHSLDCLKFAYLFLFSPVHTQFFLSLARRRR